MDALGIKLSKIVTFPTTFIQNIYFLRKRLFAIFFNKIRNMYYLFTLFKTNVNFHHLRWNRGNWFSCTQNQCRLFTVKEKNRRKQSFFKKNILKNSLIFKKSGVVQDSFFLFIISLRPIQKVLCLRNIENGRLSSKDTQEFIHKKIQLNTNSYIHTCI